MSALPAVLAAARPVQAIGYIIEIDGVQRLALTPTEWAPLLGMSTAQVIELCRSGALRFRNPHPGSRGGRYLIPAGAVFEWLAGADEPVPAAYG